MTGRVIPAVMSNDPEWVPISHILVNVFGSDERVWQYIDLPNHEICFDDMLASEQFSTYERQLLLAAASIWKGCGYEIDLGRIAYGMDDRFLAALLRCLKHARATGDLPV